MNMWQYANNCVSLCSDQWKSIIVPLLFVNILYKYARLIFVRFGIINNVDLNWE